MKEKLIEKDHHAWIDILRIFACFLVVLSHSSDPFIGQFENNYSEFVNGSLLGSIVRSCVPLFIMISGYLLLSENLNNMAAFYNKRAKRLIIPFVTWSVLLPILYFLYVNYTSPGLSSDLEKNGFTAGATWKNIYFSVLNFNYATTVLWYMYMLFGLYLFLPIIGSWLQNTSKKNIQCYLIIWVFTLFLPYIEQIAPALGYSGNFGNYGILGVCDWNIQGTFYYFSGYMGYMVLAHYLRTYPLTWSWKVTLLVALILFSVGFAITFLGTLSVLKSPIDRYKNIEVVWNFVGINVFLMTVSIFIVFQKINVKKRPWVTKLSSLTLGVYLCHFVIVQLFYDLIHPISDGIPAFFRILLIACCTFISAMITVFIISLSKILRKTIM
nr:acyltransferase family protein [Pedobacter panaciterrae]